MPWAEPAGRIEDPSADEFATWLTPQQAFGHLTFGVTQDIVDRLLRRLGDGKLYAAAEEARWREEGKRHIRHRVTIQPDWWLNSQDAQSAHALLWSTGETTILIADDSDLDHFRVNFYGVRFEWSAMFEVVPDLRRARPQPAAFGRFAQRADQAHRPADHLGPNAVAPLTAPLTTVSVGNGIRIDPHLAAAADIDPGLTQEELDALAKRLGRRRGEGPYEPAPGLGAARAFPSYSPRPAGTLEQIAPELAAYRRPESESGRRPRKRINPVTVAEIEAWYAALSEADQSLGVDALWERAQEDHHGRHLPRKLVRPFGEKRGNGHRRKR